VGEGSCFFHSLFQPYSQYKKLTVEQRMKAVSDIRKLLAKKLTMDEWLSLGNGNLARISYEQHFRELSMDFFEYATDNKDRYKVKELLSILTIRDMFKTFQTKLTSLGENMYEKLVVMILQKTPKDEDMKNEIRQFFKDQDTEEYAKYAGVLSVLFRKIMKLSKKLAYNEYVASLGSCSEWIGENNIEYISNVFNKDIYFIGRDKMPYKLTTCETSIKGRDSIVVYYIDDTHFEGVGRLDKKGDKSVITRIFKPDDPLITKLRMYYCDKENYDKVYSA
jgi:hypothetical protein